MIQWGKIAQSGTSGDGTWETITFSPSFSGTPYFFRATKSTQNSHTSEVGYLRKGSSYMTSRNVQFRNIPASDTYWIAIGPA